jgi:type VI protein secretion system component VasA
MKEQLKGIEVDAYCIVKLYKYDNDQDVYMITEVHNVYRITEVHKDYFAIGGLRFNYDGSFRYNTVTKSRSDNKNVLRVVSKKEAITFLVVKRQKESDNKHYSNLRQKCISKIRNIRLIADIKKAAESLDIVDDRPIIHDYDITLP